MLFNPAKTTFGRHETFALRYGWLTKGYRAVSENPRIFAAEEATVTLGVGKNMVNAIRYWLQATQLVESIGPDFQATALGDRIFGPEGFDPYLEDEATIWLIHWQLATNPVLATGWYWFFNRFHKPEFTVQEAATALLAFSKQNILSKSSPATIKKDIPVVLRMYARSKGDAQQPLEEALDSPLSLLGLVAKSPVRGAYSSRAGEREGLPAEILGFAVAQLFEERKAAALPIEALMYSKENACAPGAIFRMTENALITKLENLIHNVPGIFEIRETAGIHQLYLIGENPLDPTLFLRSHYQDALRGNTA